MGQLFSKLYIHEKSFSQELCLKSDSQKVRSKEDNYRRDSFEDRFCDDLCEEILQYLSLEDKLRLRCVSKQFQRTVFQRQYELFINIMDPEDHKYYLRNKYLRTRKDLNYYYIEDQSLKSFKALLKKCPNITSIELDGQHSVVRQYNSDYFNEVFRLIIIENCNNLSEINLFDRINDSNLKEFHRKFSPKMKSLGAYRFNWNLNDLNGFPNIEKLIIFNEKVNCSIFPRLSLTKLKQLVIVFNEDEGHILKTVIDTFPTLTHLSVVFKSEDENAVYESLKNISNLKHLIHFKLVNEFRINNNRFCGLLKQMANYCLNLKSIELNFCFNGQNSEIRQLLSQLKAFPALKRLNLEFYSLYNISIFMKRDEDFIDVNQLFSFELFKGFANITHLTLCFRRTEILKESILKEIDINLLNLQYLEIDKGFDSTLEGVQQMAEILSRLSRLETLKLKFKSGVDFKPIEEKITEKCRKIKTIKIQSV